MEGTLPSGVMESFAEEVKGWLLCVGNPPNTYICAASLAYHGFICSVEEMMLHSQIEDVDLTSVPAEHLASLVSCVTRKVVISNVIGCDLINILDSVKSEILTISSQNLGIEETQALVRAMESGVESVGLSGEVALDIRSLMDYSGQGKCRGVWCYSYGSDRFRYREQLKTWAKSKNWEVMCDNDAIFSMVRSGEV